MDVIIRVEAAGDHPRVWDVEAAAFGGTLQADIVEALRRDAHPHLSLVAEHEGCVVGHLFFSPVTLDAHPALHAAQLSPLAVDPSHRRRGIGGALIREGLGRCDGIGWSLVFLLGDPAYYSRFGFELAAPLGFTTGRPSADPALQVIEVVPGASAGLGGRVRFHPAFDVAGSDP